LLLLEKLQGNSRMPINSALKILVVPTSFSANVSDARLASAVTRELVALDADVTRISLGDFPLPVFDGTDSGTGAKVAMNLARMLSVHHGVFIATTEIAASLPPVLLNMLSWVASLRERGEPISVFQRAFAIGAASEDGHGGQRALIALRQVLTLGCGAHVIPQEISVSLAKHAFDDGDRLREMHDSEQAKAVARQLVDVSQRMR
jgi:chromate reductase, NAD(P)H dehydrogenase (quinone)